MLERNMGEFSGEGPDRDVSPHTEQPTTPDAIRARATDLYTVRGKERIESFREAIRLGDVGLIRSEMENALSFAQGLRYGVDASRYRLSSYKNDPRAAEDLKGKFENIEDATSKPEAHYLQLAIEEDLENIVNELLDYGETDEEKEAYKIKIRNRLKLDYREISKALLLEGNEPINEEEIDRLVEAGLHAETDRLDKLTPHLGDLMSMRDHIDARRIIADQVALEYFKSSEDEKIWMQISERMTKPDKAHWGKLYRGNIVDGLDIVFHEGSQHKESLWGHALSETENAIEGIALGTVDVVDDGKKITQARDFYVNGWQTTGEFVAWLNALKPYATINGVFRMDIVDYAWNLALLKGRISKLAWNAKEQTTEQIDPNTGEIKRVARRDENGVIVREFNFGSAPYSSDIRTKLIHSEKLRAKEWGFPANNSKGEIVDLDTWELITVDEEGHPELDHTGKIVKRKMSENDFQSYLKYANEHSTKRYRAITHSGHPLNIGRMGGRPVVDAYEDRTYVRRWKDQNGVVQINKSISLHDLSVEEGLSRSSEEFPWADTEIRTGDEPAGEPASGSWAAWHLDTIRGFNVRANFLRKIPNPRELSPDYFGTFRDWEKLKLINYGDLGEKNLPRNPVAWYLASILEFRGMNMVSMEEKDCPSFMWPVFFRSSERVDKIDSGPMGVEYNMVSWGFVKEAFRYGLISSEERHWLENYFCPKENRPKNFIPLE